MLDGRGLRLATDDGRDITGPPKDARAAPPPPKQPGPQDGSEPARLQLPSPPLDPWRLFRLIRRRPWTILAVIAAVMALTALGLGQLTPIYKASALVIVDPWQRSMLDTDPGGAPPPADRARNESAVVKLRSPAGLLGVDNPGARRDDHHY
jgi:hypothetical protein